MCTTQCVETLAPALQVLSHVTSPTGGQGAPSASLRRQLPPSLVPQQPTASAFAPAHTNALFHQQSRAPEAQQAATSPAASLSNDELQKALARMAQQAAASPAAFPPSNGGLFHQQAAAPTGRIRGEYSLVMHTSPCRMKGQNFQCGVRHHITPTACNLGSNLHRAVTCSLRLLTQGICSLITRPSRLLCTSISQ